MSINAVTPLLELLVYPPLGPTVKSFVLGGLTNPTVTEALKPRDWLFALPKRVGFPLNASILPVIFVMSILSLGTFQAISLE